jgi:hypothetical protein
LLVKEAISDENQMHQIKNELVEIGRSDCGCAVLYLDKRDGCFWELNYPDSSQHGGEPRVEILSRDEAARKYKNIETQYPDKDYPVQSIIR